MSPEELGEDPLEEDEKKATGEEMKMIQLHMLIHPGIEELVQAWEAAEAELVREHQAHHSGSNSISESDESTATMSRVWKRCPTTTWNGHATDRSAAAMSSPIVRLRERCNALPMAQACLSWMQKQQTFDGRQAEGKDDQRQQQINPHGLAWMPERRRVWCRAAASYIGWRLLDSGLSVDQGPTVYAAFLSDDEGWMENYMVGDENDRPLPKPQPPLHSEKIERERERLLTSCRDSENVIRKDVPRTFPGEAMFAVPVNDANDGNTGDASAPVVANGRSSLTRVLIALSRCLYIRVPKSVDFEEREGNDNNISNDNLDGEEERLELVGYCQGINYIAGFLLLIGLSEYETWSVCVWLGEEHGYANAWASGLHRVHDYVAGLTTTLPVVNPAVSAHLLRLDVAPTMMFMAFLCNWTITLFTGSPLPHNAICIMYVHHALCLIIHLMDLSPFTHLLIH